MNAGKCPQSQRSQSRSHIDNSNTGLVHMYIREARPCDGMPCLARPLLTHPSATCRWTTPMPASMATRISSSALRIHRPPPAAAQRFPACHGMGSSLPQERSPQQPTRHTMLTQRVRKHPSGRFQQGLDSFPIAASGRKRRRFMEPASAADGATAHAAAPQDTVLVWDLDETLILFQSLHDGRFATAFGMQACCRGTRTCMCLGWRAPNEAGLAQLRTWQRRKSWAGSGRMRSWTCAMHTSSSSRSAAGHARGQTLPLQHDCCCLVCMTTATKLSLLWPAGAGHGPDLPGQPGGSG